MYKIANDIKDEKLKEQFKGDILLSVNFKYTSNIYSGILEGGPSAASMPRWIEGYKKSFKEKFFVSYPDTTPIQVVDKYDEKGRLKRYVHCASFESWAPMKSGHDGYVKHIIFFSDLHSFEEAFEEIKADITWDDAQGWSY